MGLTKQQWNTLLINSICNSFISRGWQMPYPNANLLCYNDIGIHIEPNSQNKLVIKKVVSGVSGHVERSYVVDAQRGKFVIDVLDNNKKRINTSTLGMGLLKTEEDINKNLFRVIKLISDDLSRPNM